MSSGTESFSSAQSTPHPKNGGFLFYFILFNLPSKKNINFLDMVVESGRYVPPTTPNKKHAKHLKISLIERFLHPKRRYKHFSFIKKRKVRGLGIRTSIYSDFSMDQSNGKLESTTGNAIRCKGDLLSFFFFFASPSLVFETLFVC